MIAARPHAGFDQRNAHAWFAREHGERDQTVLQSAAYQYKIEALGILPARHVLRLVHGSAATGHGLASWPVKVANNSRVSVGFGPPQSEWKACSVCPYTFRALQRHCSFETIKRCPMAIRDELRTDRTMSGDQREGRIARLIEAQTAKIPSDIFLWAAAGTVVAALVLQLRGGRARGPSFAPPRFVTRRLDAHFVGQWAPTLLLLGLYNKVVKVLGHDAPSRAAVGSRIGA